MSDTVFIDRLTALVTEGKARLDAIQKERAALNREEELIRSSLKLEAHKKVAKPTTPRKALRKGLPIEPVPEA